MKNLRQLIIALVLMALSEGAQAQTHPALGSGTGVSGDPYQIKTPAHLKQLADFVNGGNANGNATAGVYYIVINDLDLTAYAAGEGWNPIGCFTSTSNYFQGNFNGNHKKVTNLKVNRPTTDYQGLFGYTIGAVIENLGIENCEIAGQSAVGGLVGYNCNNSTISNCYATGNVSGTSYVGGLAGYNSSSTISNCYATGNVSGTSWFVGGLVGVNYSSSISNCYATGNVSGTVDFVGGLVGVNYSSSISNCYAAGNVSGVGYVGGLVGDNYSSFSTIKNCVAANDNVVATANTTYINRICGTTTGTFQNNYALSTMAVKNSSGNIPITGLNVNAGMSKSMADFQNLAFYTTVGNWNTAAWDINDPSGVWKICPEGGMMPILRWQNGVCYVQVNDITGLPATASAGVPLTLTGTVQPSDATNQTITWSVNNAGTTGATIAGNTLNTTATGTAILTATIVNGLTQNTDYKQDFTVTVVPVAVTNITGISATALINTMLTLTGTVEPSNATNKTIVWSLVNAGTTNATISGNTFIASSQGVAFLLATIQDGKAIGEDYAQNFTITLNKVTGIESITNEELRIYPNPVKDELLIINNEQLTINHVEIVDLTGKLLLTSPKGRDNSQPSGELVGASINVSSLPQGVYFLKIQTDKGMITRKFVKE